VNRSSLYPRFKPIAGALACALSCASPAAAAAGEPPVGVPPSAIATSLVCQSGVAARHGEPVLLLGGTGSDGPDLWTWGWQRALKRAGHPSCYLGLPQHTTGDMQLAARHVVLAIRAVHARAHGPIAVYGVSQGGLLARLALTGWPRERRFVSDVISVSGIQHGSERSLIDCEQDGCPAALWQRRAGSDLLAALERAGSEAPGPTAWTTVRSLDDVVATPQDGPSPTSALDGATNLVLQKVCPGRHRDHLTLAVDSVSFAALRDALAHSGPARAARLKRPCARQYAPGLTEAVVRDRIAKAIAKGVRQMFEAPRLDAEPVVQPPFGAG
jgi:triacylglycerol lipase